MKVVAIDLGGTYLKQAILDLDKDQITCVSVQGRTTNGSTREYVKTVLEKPIFFVESLGELSKAYPVCICSQMGGKIENGVFYSWQDKEAPESERESIPLAKALEKELTERGWKVKPPIGDQLSVIAGLHLARDELSINVGTGAQISMLGTPKKQDGIKVRKILNTEYSMRGYLFAGRHLERLKEDWGIPTFTDSMMLPFFKKMAESYRSAAESMISRQPKLVLSGGVLEKNTIFRRILLEEMGKDPFDQRSGWRMVKDAQFLGLMNYAKETVK